jgi:L-ascorbate metabolism protein UlaG (beta-lactamase superfamily)
MELTKYAHACVSLSKDDARIVIDPGTFTTHAAQAIAVADAVLITHEHFDHFDENLIAEALSARPELRVYGPASVVERWSARQGQVTTVAAGQTLDIAGFEVSVFGELHAAIHRNVPRVTNVGFLVDGSLYHPGDAYHVPEHSVETLLLPTSGPWTKVGEAVDYIQAVSAKRVVQIHEVLLSEIGQQSMAMFLGPEMLGQVPLEIVPVGDAISV